MLDPAARWKHGEKPDYAGLPTFAGLPYTEDPGALREARAAIIGAPMDELVSDRPGTRLGPRAIRAASSAPGPDLESGIDPFEALAAVDFGDAPVVPGDPVASHRAIERTVAEALSAEAMPVVLGGDHSITEPEIRACAEVHGPLGLVQLDAHTDTAAELYGAELSHGTGMFRLVEGGHVDPSRYVQIGLRGHWPGPAELEWQRERGITSLFMHDLRELGVPEAVSRAVEAAGPGPAFLSVDIDVLDPAFAPGTGTPEPGGMTTAEVLGACRALARGLELVGTDVVEVIPAAAGVPDVTALAAERVVRHTLTGIALR